MEIKTNFINYTAKSVGGYYHRIDVEPTIDGDLLTLYVKPSVKGFQVEAKVILNDPDLTVVMIISKIGMNVTFWRYYLNGQRVYWKALNPEIQKRILQAVAIADNKCLLGHNEKDGLPRAYWLNQEVLLAEERQPDEVCEYSDDGFLVGYKYLLKFKDNYYSVCSPHHNPVHWRNNELEADYMPSDDLDNGHGIYAAKNPKSHILSSYSRSDDRVLVKIILSGTVVESQYGYKAQYATILEEVVL
jgi:hypothetical protein